MTSKRTHVMRGHEWCPLVAGNFNVKLQFGWPKMQSRHHNKYPLITVFTVCHDVKMCHNVKRYVLTSKSIKSVMISEIYVKIYGKYVLKGCVSQMVHHMIKVCMKYI